MTQPDTITVLTVSRGTVTKRHTWTAEGWRSSDAPEGHVFTWREVPVSDVRELSRELIMLERDPKSLVIRDVPIEGIGDKVRRLGRQQSDGTAPTFEPHELGRFWVMLDLDKAPVPPPEIATGPCEAAVRWAIATYLPPAFADVTCHYQWSGSAGIKPWSAGLRLHLWFFVNGPVCEEAWRVWAQGVPYVDASIFDRVHIHYTAAPQFVGAADPVPVRSGLIEGERVDVDVEQIVDAAGELVLVDAPTWCLRQTSRIDVDVEGQAERILDGLGPATNRRQAYARAKLEGCLREILALPEGVRNDAFFRIALTVGRVVESGGLDPTDTLRALQEAAIAVGSNPAKDRAVIQRGFERGLNDPDDLVRIGTEPLRAASSKPKDEPPKSEAPPKVEIADYFCTKDRRLTVGGRVITRGEGGEELGAQVVPVLRDAPQPDARVPVGYYITRWSTGAHGKDDRPVPIVPCAIVIAGKCIDIATQSEHFVLAWLAPDGWRQRTVARVDALSRHVQRLAEWGLPVTADGAKALSKYLVEYEAANAATLPVMRITSTFGWQGVHGADGYLIGLTHVAADGTTRRIELDRRRPETWDPRAIAFHGADGDEEVLAEAFGLPTGRWEGWLEAVRQVDKHPRILLGLFVSLAAPLIEILGAPAFILDWAAEQGTGKTTAAAMAMSVWGRPDALKRSWDAAGPYMEQVLPTLNSLPLWLDESQLASKRNGAAGAADVVANAIYTFVQGRAKGAATLTGTRKTRTWRTTMLSTGEQPLVSFAARGGTRSRVIEAVGLPFGQKSAPMGTLSAYLLDEVTQHCGHAGIRWIKFLVTQRSRWDEFVELYRECYRDASQESGGGRLAHTRAVLEVTWHLSQAALQHGLPNPMIEIWSEVTAHAVDASGTEAALADVVGWFAANRQAFKGSASLIPPESTDAPTKAEHAPTTGWLGTVCRVGDELCVAVLPHALERYLRDRGYQVPAVLAEWRTRGWTLVDTDRPQRTHRTVRFEGAAVKVVALRASLFVGEVRS